MSFLTEQFDDCFSWNNKVFNVDMSFDNILRLFEMFEDDMIINVEKPFIAIKMLIKEEIKKFKSYDDAIMLFKGLMKEFLNVDIDSTNEDENQMKVYDFKKDAEIIYASFYSEYKIDLLEMHGKLHWKKFIVLLNHLDDESRFKKVVEIRTMKIPKESSQEYRDHIIKMKEAYSLDERSKEERIDESLNEAMRILKGG